MPATLTPDPGRPRYTKADRVHGGDKWFHVSKFKFPK